MNWTNFQTYGMAPDKAFEVLCNQLFENWSKEDYVNSLPEKQIRYSDGIVVAYSVMCHSKHRLTRAHREKQLKMSCQALHNAPPNRT